MRAAGTLSRVKHSHTKPNRLSVWGDSLLIGLSARSRKRRKREASKKRRVLLEREARREGGTASGKRR